MARLADGTLPGARARLPGYDRAGVAEGIVHLGLGAFARAHLAVYIDDLLARGNTTLGIVGVSLRHDDVPAALTPQDGLYSLAVIDGERMSFRVVGSVRRVLHAPSQPDAVRRALGDPQTSMITITVTEKGYCWDAATRRLDIAHPDVQHDLTHPASPRSVIGHLLLAAIDRRSTGAGGVTVLSLDNVPANGAMLRSAVLDMAASTDPGLSAWIAANMAFPCSMVDRMVPSTDDALRAAAAEAIGLDDAWPVRAEPFSQWVVERAWAQAPPPLAAVGVDVVDDVAPWERLKLRVLNALHTAAALYGLRHGLATVDQVATDPDGRALLERVAAEIAEVLPDADGVAVDRYIATTFARFANAGLGHRCAQIATDSSQKLPQRVLDTVRDRRRLNLPVNALADVLALWAWSTLGRDHLGKLRQVDDPLAAVFAGIARTTQGDFVALATALIGLDEIFGDLAGDAVLIALVAARLTTC